MKRDRAERKKRRKAEAEAYAADARFWLGLRSADRLNYNRPINRQAAKELKPKKRR